jgi:D-glycero-D-manno-heptose 1,7-bisphosphate phosphatase
VSAAVFFDRDGTLIKAPVVDGKPLSIHSPEELELEAGAEEACAALRDACFALVVVTNQPEIARGTQTLEGVGRINERLLELLPLDEIVVCPHDDADGCMCRKPMPGLVRRAAELLGVPTAACVLIGDTRADVCAAYGAGAIGMLVPNDRTLPLEVRGVAHVHGDFADAVSRVLEWRSAARPAAVSRTGRTVGRRAVAR